MHKRKLQIKPYLESLGQENLSQSVRVATKRTRSKEQHHHYTSSDFEAELKELNQTTIDQPTTEMMGEPCNQMSNTIIEYADQHQQQEQLEYNI